jgi:hypothetical protein
MTMQEGLEIFERAADARGRLLRVEADRSGSTVSDLILTFDVGRIGVTPADEGLAIRHFADASELPAGLAALDEEEPWWRLLGHPITAAWPGGVEEGVGAQGLSSLMVLKLRFREDSENPRVIRLEAVGKAVRVSLEGL